MKVAQKHVGGSKDRGAGYRRQSHGTGEYALQAALLLFRDLSGHHREQRWFSNATQTE